MINSGIKTTEVLATVGTRRLMWRETVATGILVFLQRILPIVHLPIVRAGYWS